MRRLDTLKIKKKSFSIEIEPPNLGRSIKDVFEMLDPLVALGVEYVDITYHPEQIVGHEQLNGEKVPIYQRKKPGTAGVAGAILGKYNNRIQPVPHVICTGFTKYETEEYVIELSYLGVENMLALRGDSAKGPNDESLPFIPVKGGHSHASELIQQIINLRKGAYVGAKEGGAIDFCIGAGCYPEMHPESFSLEQDILFLKKKVEAGAEYLTTQLFFDNEKFYAFIDEARKHGIDVPILPGLKPITQASHLASLPQIFSCTFPQGLQERISKAEDKEEAKKIGIDHCIQQSQDLLNNGFTHLHFYAARKAPIEEIIKAL